MRQGEDQFIIRLARAIRERERFVHAMNRGHYPIFQRNILLCEPVGAAQIKILFLRGISAKMALREVGVATARLSSGQSA